MWLPRRPRTFCPCSSALPAKITLTPKKHGLKASPGDGSVCFLPGRWTRSNAGKSGFSLSCGGERVPDSSGLPRVLHRAGVQAGPPLHCEPSWETSDSGRATVSPGGPVLQRCSSRETGCLCDAHWYFFSSVLLPPLLPSWPPFVFQEEGRWSSWTGTSPVKH